MIWVVADTHFSHKNIIDYCNRPYKNVEDMNKDLIFRWNSCIHQNDVVLHLGDVGFGSAEELTNLILQLNGYKFLIRGNHDFKRGYNFWTNVGFIKVYKERELELPTFLNDVENCLGIKESFGFSNTKWEYPFVIFSHFPRSCGENVLNIHGHIHNVPLNEELYNLDNHYCVSVEQIQYMPTPLERVIKIM